MKISIKVIKLVIIYLVVLLGGCAPVSTLFSITDTAPSVYNTSINVVDENGTPIPKATITQAKEVYFTDNHGLLQRSSQSPNISISVWALGYLRQEHSSILQAGENKILIQLSPNPFILRVSDFNQEKDKKRYVPRNPYCLCPGAAIDDVGVDTPLDPCPPEAQCPED